MARRAALLFGIVVLVPILIGVAIGIGLNSDEIGWLGTAARVVGIVAGAMLVIGALARSGWRRWAPVRHLIDAAGRLADGDYTARVPVARSGSLRSASISFNSMAAQLESARRQRRQLLADVGHELRTPLTIIRGELEALVDGVHPPDTQHLTTLLDDVAVMERLLDDLRTLSLAEAGALDLHPEPVDLVALATDAAEALTREAAASGVTVRVDGDAEIGDQMVDPVRMREVLTNLMVNAIRAMPDGGRLDIAVRRDAGGVTITVRDSGVGIPPEAQERVFDRFQKAGRSAGTGLGLTISRDLVAAHGGSLTLVSSSAAGTTMRVSLPDVPG